MPILVTCPGCKAQFNVGEKFAGKQGPCPKCKALITIPKISGASAPPPTPEGKAGPAAATKPGAAPATKPAAPVGPPPEVKIHGPDEASAPGKTKTGAQSLKPLLRN